MKQTRIECRLVSNAHSWSAAHSTALRRARRGARHGCAGKRDLLHGVKETWAVDGSDSVRWSVLASCAPALQNVFSIEGVLASCAPALPPLKVTVRTGFRIPKRST
jgi:hypothetical protein